MTFKRCIKLDILVTLLCAAVVFAGCAQGRPTITFNGPKAATLSLEAPKTPAGFEKGLMFRKSLPEDEGMLFDFEREVTVSFWMKDTSIPLSIAFITPGMKVIGIEDMQPFDLTSVEPPGPYRYAVEANLGWFADHGVAVGSTAELSGL